MDIKRLLTTMALTAVIMMAAYFLFPSFFGKGPAKGAAGGPAPYPLYAFATAQPSAAEQAAAPETRVLGSAEKASKDKLEITINNVTAAIDKVRLNQNDYAQTVARSQPFTLLEAQPGLAKPFATLSARVSGAGPEDNYADFFAHQYVWKFTTPEKPGATECSLLATVRSASGEPLIEITKTFKIDPTTYEITISHSIKNLSGKDLKVEIDQLGPTDLPPDDPRSDSRNYHAAGLDSAGKFIDGSKVTTAHAKLLKLPTGTQELGKFVAANPLVWAGATNRFFAAVVRPAPGPNPAMVTLTSGLKIPLVEHIASADIDVMRIDPDVPASTVTVMRLSGSRLSLPANGEVSMPLSVFLGPKKRDLLKGQEIAPYGSEPYFFAAYRYFSLIQFNTGCYCGYFSDVLAPIILNLFDILARYVTFGNYGIAIMLLVIVVRAALHPLTRASQINMAKMSKSMTAIKPELDAAKKKYAKDSAKQQQEMMRIYKEHNVNPAGGIMGCLPMLIQMPIWLALYSGLQVDIDLRHAAFIPGWINDLSAPDAVLSWTPVNIPLLSLLLGPVGSLNLLPILLGLVFYVQMKVTMATQPQAASMDPQQAQMQKMSQYMILIFPLFLYSAPSGLNVYIFASTMGGLLDTYIVRRALRAKGILPANAPALPTHELKDKNDM
jgi:YidC/Oxa1 family membrane protein insertase